MVITRPRTTLFPPTRGGADQLAAWKEAVERGGGEEPTARQLEEVGDEVPTVQRTPRAGRSLRVWGLFTLSESFADKREENEALEHEVELVVAGEDAPKSLEAPDQAFDLVASSR